VDASELMVKAAGEMNAMAAREGVELSISPLEAPVFADADRVLQTLTNLLSNAIKFSAAGARVRLAAEERGEEVLFSVQDQGRGIPAESLDTIFERFQQVDSSDARQKGGTGLGLAISRSIVQQHGGEIWVESELGKGSTFFFTLPRYGSHERRSDPAELLQAV
jgi:signal transduction histidine kinase